MGLIKALSGAIRSTLADQWKEYFHCDAMQAGVMMVKGRDRKAGSNTKGSDDIITKNSVIAVSEGQAMVVTDNGRIVDFTCEAGAYVFEASGQPSMFAGNFGQGLIESFREIGKRFAFGGATYTTQRVYYINTREMTGNGFASSQPVPYDDPHYQTVLYVNYNGVYSLKITDPLQFYTAVAGNAADSFTVSQLTAQLGAEFYGALDSALGSFSGVGVRFSQLPSKQADLSRYMQSALNTDWEGMRGISVMAVGINKITPDEKSRERIETFDSAAMLGRSGEAMQGRMASAQAAALENLGKMPGGASGTDMMGAGLGMMALNMMNNMMAQQQPAASQQPAAAAAGWACACGRVNTDPFCGGCGAKQ